MNAQLNSPAEGAAAVKRPNLLALPAAGTLLLLLYGVLYFVSVIDGQFSAVPNPLYMRTYTVSRWVASPYYRGFPAPVQAVAQWGFAPAHYLDRHLFRPAKWSGPIRFPAAPPAPPPVAPPSHGAVTGKVSTASSSKPKPRRRSAAVPRKP